VSIHPSIHPSIFLSIYLSIHPSICPSTQALGEDAPALPSTLVSDHPTARQLAAFFQAQEVTAAPAQSLSTPPVASNSAEVVLLVLHGEGGDSLLMRRILELSGWLTEFETQGVRLEFIDAPHVVRPIPQLFGSLSAAGEYGRESYFGWGMWGSVAGDAKDEPNLADAVSGRELSVEDEAGRAAATSESVRHVEHWIKQHSPISGICGISAGATIAAAVAARSSSLQFFINFCSLPWDLLPKSMNLEVPQSISMPSLHVLGRADTVLSPAQLWSVPSRCENTTTLWHKGGHVVPLLDGATTVALRRFLGVGSIVQAPTGDSDRRLVLDGRTDSNSLVALVEAVAQMTGRALTADIPLLEAGLESLALVELATLLSERYPTAGDIPQTIAFEYPTLRAIDAHLTAVDGSGGAVQPLEEQPALGFDYSGAIDLQQALPVPLPVPLYLALEAMLIVSLQLADALPLCAALLSASFVAHHTSALVGQMLLPLCLVIAALLNMLATVALKWAVLGRVRPGEHPLHGWWHLRYWFVESRLHCHDLLLRNFLVGTPLYNAWLRLLGARIGAGARVNTVNVGAALDLLTIGAAANVGACSISCHHVPQSGVMVLAPVVVGARAVLGPQSIVMPGANVGEATVVGACCAVAQTLPSHTFWAGQPMQQVPADPLEGVTYVRSAEQDSGASNSTVDPALTEVLPRRGIDMAGRLMALRPLLSLLMVAWCGSASIGGLIFGALVYFPRARLTAVGWDSWGVALILLASFAWVWQPVMLLLAVFLKWLLVGRCRPGVHARRYPLWKAACSSYCSILSDLTGSRPFILMPPSIASLYLRLCGAVVGRRVIIHNPLRHVSQADLLRLGDGSFMNKSTKLNLQLPIASEPTLNVRVHSSIFDLGKARRPPLPALPNIL